MEPITIVTATMIIIVLALGGLALWYHHKYEQANAKIDGLNISRGSLLADLRHATDVLLRYIESAQKMDSEYERLKAENDRYARGLAEMRSRQDERDLAILRHALIHKSDNPNNEKKEC